jgi:metal-dependent amidase/aminoacylase/carboxypeptidase family protein
LSGRRGRSFGVSVYRGIARTGVIGTLKGSLPNDRAIALRADMDALHIEEQNDVPHASRHRRRMHACGHGGDTAMLLLTTGRVTVDDEAGVPIVEHLPIRRADLVEKLEEVLRA